ncbi:MAG: DNA polymerase III subunit beta [Synergistetes bacterium HGW-Synergistetes-2]|nr:MAG: DNA polymerase III subunit beta [Synergistetes bacterium HGW-Synergistetes-2]
MRLQISKGEFMKNWQIAERSTSSKSTINSLTGVLLRTADTDSSVLMEATDLKTSIKCISQGVLVEEEGEAVLPVKLVGELFKKAPTNVFTVSITDGKGIIIAGRNKYKFTTYSPREFPKLPVSESAAFFCTATASELLRAASEGTVACTTGEEFPKYLGTAFFQLRDGEMRVVATDGRRLSLSKCSPVRAGENCDFLLPITGVRELQRLLGALDGESPIEILVESTLVFFQMGSMEFSVRRVDTAFPNYENILNPQTTTTMDIDRHELIAALERVDVIVRDFSHMVLIRLSPEGDLLLTGKAPETGAVQEVLDAKIEGESLTVAFNVSFLIEGLKALYGDRVFISFNGPDGQMTMLRPGEKDFLYMAMPIKINESDLLHDEMEEENETEIPE